MKSNDIITLSMIAFGVLLFVFPVILAKALMVMLFVCLGLYGLVFSMTYNDTKDIESLEWGIAYLSLASGVCYASWAI